MATTTVTQADLSQALATRIPVGSQEPTEKQPQQKQPSALELVSQGVPLEGIPYFSDMERKRRWMLEHLAGAFRVIARKGFSEGMSGHISLRDPENPHTFWTNPLGMHFGLLTAGDMILVNEEGVAIGGNTTRPANAAGFLIHSVIHQTRPDVHAACHFHSRFGKAWSAFGRPLEMINQDVAIFYGDAQAVYADFGGVVFKKEEALSLAKALGPAKGMILQNHGLITVGGTVDEAAYLYTLMERSCEVQLLAEAAAANGIPKRIISEEAAKYTYEATSDPEALYCEFQPDFQLEKHLTNGEFAKF